jgi:hypothetical protein
MAIMGPALDRERQRTRLRPLSCEEGSAPLNHPHLGDLLEKVCEPPGGWRPPYGRAGMDSLFQRPQALTPIPPSPTEHTERALILRHIRASTGSKISFSYLADYAQSVGLDGTKLAQIITDLIHLGHVALTDEGHKAAFRLPPSPRLKPLLDRSSASFSHETPPFLREL